jgi:putative addiction module CopG family antidote
MHRNKAKERRYISQITNESVSVRHVSFYRLICDTREHFFEFVEGQVRTARRSGEVVRAALRLLEEREMKLAVLRAALIEGGSKWPATRSA